MDWRSKAQTVTGPQQELVAPKGDGAIPPFSPKGTPLSNEHSLIPRGRSSDHRRLHP